mmetsp:Transcript_52161/g.138055  ORF Transcript_52161/g.138055 Transcript_52161/m.138055 type:complete len:297 (+) Transcript_52161:35-925(+)
MEEATARHIIYSSRWDSGSISSSVPSSPATLAPLWDLGNFDFGPRPYQAPSNEKNKNGSTPKANANTVIPPKKYRNKGVPGRRMAGNSISCHSGAAASRTNSFAGSKSRPSLCAAASSPATKSSPVSFRIAQSCCTTASACARRSSGSPAKTTSNATLRVRSSCVTLLSRNRRESLPSCKSQNWRSLGSTPMKEARASCRLCCADMSRPSTASAAFTTALFSFGFDLHSSTLQSSVSTISKSGHGAPCPCGSRITKMYRCLRPPPHGFEHDPQRVHELSLQSTSSPGHGSIAQDLC